MSRSGGNRGVPRVPCAKAWNTGTQSISTGAATALTFNASEDPFGFWDTATKLIVPKGCGGLYLCSGYLQFAANAVGNRTGEVVLNSAQILAGTTGAAPATGSSLQGGASLRRLEVGDSIETFAFQSSGGALLTSVASGVQINHVAVLWVAP